MTASPRRLFLCADDYGMNQGIDDACHILAAAGRLSAVSVMTRSPRWHTGVAARQMPACAVGLHLELTENWRDGSLRFSLPGLLLRATTGLLPWRRIAVLLQAQFSACEDALGRAPDFVDGHQHIHQFPQLRDLVLTEMQQRYGRSTIKPWLRATGTTRQEVTLKGKFLNRLGGEDFRQQVRLAGFRCNQDFAGSYDFDAKTGVYAQHMSNWLHRLSDGAVMMCHPSRGRDDRIAAAREQEYRFLASAQFGECLQDQNIVLVNCLP